MTWWQVAIAFIVLVMMYFEFGFSFVVTILSVTLFIFWKITPNIIDPAWLACFVVWASFAHFIKKGIERGKRYDEETKAKMVEKFVSENVDPVAYLLMELRNNVKCQFFLFWRNVLGRTDNDYEHLAIFTYLELLSQKIGFFSMISRGGTVPKDVLYIHNLGEEIICLQIAFNVFIERYGQKWFAICDRLLFNRGVLEHVIREEKRQMNGLTDKERESHSATIAGFEEQIEETNVIIKKMEELLTVEMIMKLYTGLGGCPEEYKRLFEDIVNQAEEFLYD